MVNINFSGLFMPGGETIFEQIPGVSGGWSVLQELKGNIYINHEAISTCSCMLKIGSSFIVEQFSINSSKEN